MTDAPLAHDPPLPAPRLAVVLALALLAWSGLANLGLGERFYLGRNLVLTAGLLMLARAAGLTAEELGLERRSLARGAWWGAASGVLVAVVLLVAVALADRLEPVALLLRDERAALPTGELLFHALLRIPLGTAVFEEVAFRAVLLALLVRSLPLWSAITVSSAVFGLWHVAPTIVALRINDVAPLGPEGLGAIIGAVAVTAVAGVLFCWLRYRAGSLLAPILAHWATNGLGLVAAATTSQP